MAEFRISSAATEDLKCILEQQIHRRRRFGVVVLALVPAGVQAWALQHCRSTRIGPEPEKAEHPELFYFKFRILSRKFEIEMRGVDR